MHVLNRIKSFITAVGAAVYKFFVIIGQVSGITVHAFAAIGKLRTYRSQVIEQFIYLGRRSLPIVLITAVFIGLALGVQLGTQFNPTVPKWLMGQLILRTMLLEMGPSILGLILAARIGSGIASELGAMKVTEQLDAMRTLAIDPVEYLVMPRLAAAMVVFPILLIFNDLLGVLSGFVSAHLSMDLSWFEFVKGLRHGFYMLDVFTSIFKAFLYSMIIVIWGSYFGMYSKGGAKGVGNATTNSVVWSSVQVLILDYVLSEIRYLL